MRRFLCLFSGMIWMGFAAHDSWAKSSQVLEVLSLPALEVFVGRELTQSIYYWGGAVVGGGLILAVVAVSALFIIRKLSLTLVIRIFATWMVFVAGISAVALSVYVGQNKQNPVLRADSKALPRNIKIQVQDRNLRIIWKTEKPSIGQLVYTTNLRNDEMILLSNHAEPQSEHVVTIPIKEEESEFWISVISDGQEYRLGGEPMHLRI